MECHIPHLASDRCKNKGVLKMAVVINTNVDSLKIQGLLSSSTNKMSQSMQRMSSGLKILSAKDDAAGTVISAKIKKTTPLHEGRRVALYRIKKPCICRKSL